MVWVEGRAAHAIGSLAARRYPLAGYRRTGFGSVGPREVTTAGSGTPLGGGSNRLQALLEKATLRGISTQ